MGDIRGQSPDGGISLEPENPVMLPGDAIEKQLERIEVPFLDDKLESIADTTGLTFRRDVEASLDEIPELASDDSDSELQSLTPELFMQGMGYSSPEDSTPFEAFSNNSDKWSETGVVGAPKSFYTCFSDNDSGLNPIIGGAVVRNLCLVVPNKNLKTFADLPVNAIPASEDAETELIAALPDKGPKEPPLLLLPQERRAFDESAPQYSPQDPTLTKSDISMQSSNFTTLGSKSDSKGDLIELADKAPEKSKEDAGIGAAELEEYVLSGDIENFFGIKGLTGKLYKYKGPEKDKNKKGKEKKDSDKTTKGDQDVVDDSTTIKGKSKSESNADVVEPTEEKKGKKEGKKEKKEEPAREKVKINPQSLALQGKPLGTIFPFIESDDIKWLPIEKLHFTYSEEKENFLFPPGLRLEADVPFKDSLQWAGDALKKLFGQHTPPKAIHLSAHLSNERDWSKRPKVEKLILQGSFDNMKLKPWDCLNFKTMGLEIVAEQATKTPSKKDDKSDEKKTDTGDKPKPNEDAEEAEITTVAAAEATETKKDKKTEGGKSEEKKEEEKEEKEKEKKSWYFSFGLFGVVQITNIPHANAPLEMKYRIARDFSVKKSEKKKKEGKDDEKEDKAEDSETVSETKKNGADKDMDTKEDTKKDKKADTEKVDVPAEHERHWNLVIVADQWKDIYGIKNLTMSEARLKTDFKEGDFGNSVCLELSGTLKLGGGKLKVKGSFSRDNNSLSAEIGDLKFSDIKKIHAQMSGQELPDDETDKKEKVKDEEKEKTKGDEETAGNELTFKKLKLSLSSKKSKKEKTTKRALELDGEVAFNEHTSANASLKFASEGITITGGVADFKVPETSFTVKKAGLLIFVAFKSKKIDKKENKKEKAEDTAKTKEIADGEDGKPGDEETTASDTKEKSEGTTTEKEVTKPKDVSKRESKFAVLGVIDINEITVKVGFYIERKKGAKKREWLAFGAIESIKLRQVWDAIPEDNFLNLQLDNVALIASSVDRKKKKKQKKEEGEEKGEKKKGDDKSDQKKVDKKAELEGGEAWDSNIIAPKDVAKKDEGKEEKGKKDGKSKDEKKSDDKKDEEPANWDVMAEVDAYNYPIVKGLQLCATIPSFKQLEDLNDKKKIEGLTIVISINSKGKFSASIDLPESFKVRLSEEASFGRFRTRIGLGTEGPELLLGATLTWLCKDSKPILVNGEIVGTLKGARGDLYMEKGSEWVNPFNLNKNLVLSNLGIGAGFKYATVLVTGPDEVSLSGRAQIGNFDFSMAMGVRALSADAVFKFKYPNKLDVMELVDMAGTLTEHGSLKTLSTSGCKGMVVFEDLLLYLSTGAEFLGTYYERGIQAKGKLEFFGKKGEFDGTFNDDGVIIKAGMDNFNIGGLEVKSTRPGEKRAIMDIEMTKDVQKIFIDGMIKYYEFELKVFIDADLQRRYLKADVSVKFTDSLAIRLIAEIDASNGKRLDEAVVRFEGTLDADIFGAILDGINKGIESLEKLAVKAIEDVEADLKRQIKTKQSEIDKIGEELAEMEKQNRDELLKKREKIDEQNTKLNGLRKDLSKYEEAYQTAKREKQDNDQAIAEQKAKRDEAERKLEAKEREMREEYQLKIEQEKKNRADWEAKKKALQDEKDRSWGDDLRKGESADRSWNWWTAEEKKLYDWKCRCESNLASCWWWEKAYWAVKLAEAAAGLEKAHAQKAIDAELRHVAHDIMNTQAFKDIEYGINDAGRHIEQFGRALERLTSEGLYGYIHELSKDERRDIDRQIEILNELTAKSEELERNLEIAKKALDTRSREVSAEEKAAQDRIAVLDGEIKMLPMRKEYQNKKRDHDNVVAQMNGILSTLKDIKNGVRIGASSAKAIVDTLKKGVPRITHIIVRASNDTLKDNEPLLFEIHTEWLDKPGVFSISWSPNQDPSELYKLASNKLLTGSEDVTLAPPASFPTPDPPKKVSALYMVSQGVGESNKKVQCNSFYERKWTTADGFSPKKTTSGGLTSVTYNNQLHVFQTNDSKSVIHHVFDGKNWTLDEQLKQTDASDGISVVVFREKLYLLHQGIRNRKPTIFYKVLDGNTWEDDKWVPNSATEGGMSAVVFENQLFVVHQGFGPSRNHLQYNVFDGHSWAGDKTVVNVRVAGEVATVVYHERMHVFHRRPGDNRIWYNIFAGGVWSGERRVPKSGGFVTASGGLAAAVYNGMVYLFFSGEGDKSDKVYFTMYNFEAFWAPKEVPLGGASKGVALAVFDRT